MRVLDIIATANRNLGRSKLRTILTASAIFVGAFTLSLTTALGTGAQGYFDRQLGNVTAPGVFFVSSKAAADFGPGAGLGSEVAEYNPQAAQSGNGLPGLTQKDLQELREVKGVASAQASYQLEGEYLTREGQKKYQAPGISRDIGLNFDLAAGKQIQPGSSAQAVLPEAYVGPLGFTDASSAVGKSITLGYKTRTGEDRKLDLRITGVLKKTLITEGAIVVDNAAAQTIAEAQDQTRVFYGAFVRFNDTNPDLEAAQKQQIEQSGKYAAISLKDQIASISSVISAITAALNVVGIIALLAASFGIINTLLMSVYERTREIGLMKALGMRRAGVFAMFAVEAMLVGFWGSAVAVAVALGASKVVNQVASNTFLKDFEGFELLVVNWQNALLVIGGIMVIAFLAGTLPAIKAARLDPIDALRSE